MLNGCFGFAIDMLWKSVAVTVAVTRQMPHYSKMPSFLNIPADFEIFE